MGVWCSLDGTEGMDDCKPFIIVSLVSDMLPSIGTSLTPNF